MNADLLTNFSATVKEKLGDENASIIAGDIGDLITQNKLALEEIEKLSNENKNQKTTIDQLTHANAQLLQQIPVAPEPTSPNVQEETKEFSFFDQFDEKGNFKIH